MMSGESRQNSVGLRKDTIEFGDNKMNEIFYRIAADQSKRTDEQHRNIRISAAPENSSPFCSFSFISFIFINNFDVIALARTDDPIRT